VKLVEVQDRRRTTYSWQDTNGSSSNGSSVSVQHQQQQEELDERQLLSSLPGRQQLVDALKALYLPAGYPNTVTGKHRAWCSALGQQHTVHVTAVMCNCSPASPTAVCSYSSAAAAAAADTGQSIKSIVQLSTHLLLAQTSQPTGSALCHVMSTLRTGLTSQSRLSLLCIMY
jgi:hypothetical protein